MRSRLRTRAKRPVRRPGGPSPAVGAIVAGAHYSLRLDATLEGTDTAGSASVTFYVARPPSSGRLLASPAAVNTKHTTPVLARVSVNHVARGDRMRRGDGEDG